LKISGGGAGSLDLGTDVCACAEPTLYASVVHMLGFEFEQSRTPTRNSEADAALPLSDFERLLQQFKNEDVRRGSGRQARDTRAACAAGDTLDDSDDLWDFDDDDDDDDDDEEFDGEEGESRLEKQGTI
jgi:hypothetical protein